MKENNCPVYTKQEEIEQFLKDNNIKQENHPKNYNEMVDRFYDDDCIAKLYYMGMYSVKKQDSNGVQWQAWTRERFAHSYLDQIESDKAQKLFRLMGSPMVMNVYKALIDNSLCNNSVTINQITDGCKLDIDTITPVLQALKECNLITETDANQEKSYSVSLFAAEGFTLLLAGISILQGRL